MEHSKYSPNTKESQCSIVT